MKIFIICSKRFYHFVPEVKEKLELLGHEIILPNCYDNPETENEYRGTEEHKDWKAEVIRHSEEVISSVDAVFVLNYMANVDLKSAPYLGGATFLEMYDAFRLRKKIYMLNYPADNFLKDEIIGFGAIIVGNNFEKINM